MPTEYSVNHFSVTPQLTGEVHSAVFPLDMEGRRPSGVSAQYTYSGKWADMQTLMQQKLQLGSLAQQVQCQLSRQPGDTGQLQVTVSEHLSAGGGGGGGGGGNTVQDVGTSENNPSYTLRLNKVQESIMLHPLIADAALSDQVLALLNYLAKGGDMGDVIWLLNGKQMRLQDALTMYSVDPNLVRLVRTPQFLDVQIELTATWSVSPDTITSNMPTGLHIETPPGPFKTPAGRNWLFIGGHYQVTGTDTQAVKTYLLSGPGGWSSTVYPSP